MTEFMTVAINDFMASVFIKYKSKRKTSHMTTIDDLSTGSNGDLNNNCRHKWVKYDLHHYDCNESH